MERIERKINPVAQAYEEMPQVWYEKIGLRGTRMFGVALWGLVEFGVWGMGIDVNDPYARLAGGCVYAAGLIADRVSTGFSFDISRKIRGIKEQGINIDYEMVEDGPLIGNPACTSEYYRNPKPWLLDVSMLAVAALYMPLGIAAGLMRGCAAMNNFRITKRGSRIAELAALEQSSYVSLQGQ